MAQGDEPAPPLLGRRVRIALAGLAVLVAGGFGVRQLLAVRPLNVGTTERVVLRFTADCLDPSVTAFGVRWHGVNESLDASPPRGPVPIPGTLYRDSLRGATFRSDDGRIGRFEGLLGKELSDLTCRVLRA